MHTCSHGSPTSSHVPWSLHCCRWMPSQRRLPGRHSPAQLPSTQACSQLVLGPHSPLSSQTWTAFPEHCTASRVHVPEQVPSWQAPLAHRTTAPHPPSLHVRTPSPAHCVCPAAHAAVSLASDPLSLPPSAVPVSAAATPLSAVPASGGESRISTSGNAQAIANAATTATSAHLHRRLPAMRHRMSKGPTVHRDPTGFISSARDDAALTRRSQAEVDVRRAPRRPRPRRGRSARVRAGHRRAGGVLRPSITGRSKEAFDGPAPAPNAIESRCGDILGPARVFS
jgi:hypothetical protein